MSKIFEENIDSHPYTGVRKVTGKIKVKDNDLVRNFVNGAENYVKVENITPGKVYEVVQKEGHGDVEDLYIIDDANEIQCLGSFFFEEIEKDFELQPGNE